MARTSKRLQPVHTAIQQSGDLPLPEGLPAAAQALWLEVMAASPETHWRPADSPLLETFVRTSALAREAAQRLETEGQLLADGKPSPWARLLSEHGKSMASLAGKLRLCPSSRIRAESASLRLQPSGRKPWESSSPVAEFFDD